MLGFLQQFAHSAEMRESKDEMLIGEIVRAMSRHGRPAVMFRADEGRQVIRFLTPRDALLHSVFVTLDRKTGSSAISEALIGSKATLTLMAEVKNRLADPDDLVKMYTTDLANLFKMPVLGGIKLNHQMNSVLASTTVIIEIGDYIGKGDAGADKLSKLLDGTVTKLAEKLQPYKK
jgi:hypothetical protein